MCVCVQDLISAGLKSISEILVSPGYIRHVRYEMIRVQLQFHFSVYSKIAEN
jgi:hypothetical protein